MTTTNIRFLKNYQITFYSFPGAASYSGGFNAAEYAFVASGQATAA